MNSYMMREELDSAFTRFGLATNTRLTLILLKCSALIILNFHTALLDIEACQV